MLARQSKLRHPSGAVLQTPLLLPSFSSKGFAVDSEGRSEIRDPFKLATEVITEAYLVSAYDIHYQQLPAPSEFSAVPEMIFVDSGGYEVEYRHDLSTVYRHAVSAREWDEAKHQAVLDAWPEHLPAVFVNYDSPGVRRPLADQVSCAMKLVRRYPQQMHAFLLKPLTGT